MSKTDADFPYALTTFGPQIGADVPLEVLDELAAEKEEPFALCVLILGTLQSVSLDRSACVYHGPLSVVAKALRNPSEALWK